MEAALLYKLEAENFFSIRDRQVLDLTISPNVPDPDGRYAPIFPGSDLRAPKAVALYGANASGKTNVLKALEFVAGFTRDSAQRTVPGFTCERFNDEQSRSRPIKLAAELGAVMELSPEIQTRLEAGEKAEYGFYRYELEIEVVDGLARRVRAEALRQKPAGRGKWQRVFERDESGNVLGSQSFPLSGYRHLLNTLRPNVSVIASFAMFEHPTAKLLHERLQRIRSNLALPADIRPLAELLRSHPDLVARLNHDLSRIDTGVAGLRLDFDAPNGPLLFRHEGLQVEMPWVLESEGTRRFVRQAPILAVVLGSGGIAIMDELDVAIHPNVLPEILRWFYDKQRNPYDAQLWISCHSASLLDELTKEEVVLCQKDRLGRTEMFSLMDVKSLRRDENLYRKYLSGVYGAVPHIG